MGKEIKEILTRLQNLPNLLSGLTDKYDLGAMSEMFKGNNFGEQIKNSMNFFDSVATEKGKYKEMSTLVKLSAKIDSGSLGNIKNNFVNNFNELMQESQFQMSFTEFSELVLKNYFGEKEINNWERFSMTFSNLNLIGYKSDKLQKGLDNYHNDMTHAFYAAHCDFFVTDDDRTYWKSKAAYETIGIKTKVCKVDEFLQEIESLSFTFNFTEDFLQKTNVQTSGSEPSKHYCDIITKKEIRIWHLNQPCFNYFNKYIQIIELNGKWIIYYTKDYENYSSYIFIDEIKKLANIFFHSLGTDIFGKEEVDEETELIQIKNGDWKGRSWLVGKFVLNFGIVKDEQSPVLKLYVLPKP